MQRAHLLIERGEGLDTTLRVYSTSGVGALRPRYVAFGDYSTGGISTVGSEGATNGESARDFVEVVAVNGLTQFEHDVVGDVDHEGDGTHAGQAQSRGHPTGRGAGGINAGDNAGDEDGCPGAITDGRGVVDGDRKVGAECLGRVSATRGG